MFYQKVRNESMTFDPQESQPATALLPSDESTNNSKPEASPELFKKARPVPQMAQTLEQVIKMAQASLNISAASVLLFRDNDQELYFEAASGPVGKVLRQVKLNSQYGIAGQVARTGKPLIVNDVTRSENFHKMIDNTTGFSTKSLICAPLIVNHRILGVIEVLNKLDGSRFEEKDLEVTVSIANMAAISIENIRQHQNILSAFKTTLTTLISAIDAKDPSMRGHSRRVTEYALLGSSYFSLTDEEKETLEYAGLLHDIGNIMIDSWVLNKADALNTPEWEIVRQHPSIGANLLKQIPFLENASEVVLYHHERYDGQGYPEGLKGEEIPLGARLIAVADAYDAMTTDRSYRSAMTIDSAIKELHSGAGVQFCPEAVKALISGLHLDNRPQS
jgi:HD-GYP domain-containing protein (c-di-GMP phosphodiesterase class II)